MGFDHKQPGPVVNVHKRTTKVNLWIVVGVLVFLAAGGLVIWVFTHQQPGG